MKDIKRQRKEAFGELGCKCTDGLGWGSETKVQFICFSSREVDTELKN